MQYGAGSNQLNSCMRSLDEIINNHEYFRDDQPVRYAGRRPLMLDEITAPDMLHIIDPRDLPHQDYEPYIKYVHYVETKGNTMKFFVPSPSMDLNEWNFYVQWIEWDAQVRDHSINAVEASRLLYWSGNIRVHCGCPSFLFHGYQYMLTQLDASIEPENIYPHIRNPSLRGILCKHGRRVIKVLGFHLGTIAKEVKNQRESG